MSNIILNSDSYKFSHFAMFPPEMEGGYAYLESRGGKFPATIMFGIRYALMKYLANRVTMIDVEEAEEFAEAHGVPFNRDGWTKIVRTYAGRLPITINAVPEGILVPTNVPLVTASCEDPDLCWLFTYIETWLLRGVWYPTTVATLSFECKRIFKKYMEMTCDNLDELPFKLVDFGQRGVSSEESAMIGGAAHLVNFMASDTVEGIRMAQQYYRASMPGISIPALEHSITTAWGEDREEECYRNALEVYGGEGKLLACVSDTYDLFNAVENIIGGSLRKEIADSKTTFIVRPDSGDPVFVVSGVMRILAEKFGTTLNSKGYKVLNGVSVIQGDGVNINSIERILHSLEQQGFSVDNIACGMGGGLLQQVDRDTNRFAMKASAIKVNGEWKGIRKNPATDPGKASKAGRVMAGQEVDGGPIICTLDPSKSIMKTMYKNGEFSNLEDFDVIRERANSYL